MSHPDATRDYEDDQQQQDMDAREWALLEALQKIDRAGFHDEALLFAFEGGVLSQFKKELEYARAR